MSRLKDGRFWDHLPSLEKVAIEVDLDPSNQELVIAKVKNLGASVTGQAGSSPARGQTHRLGHPEQLVLVVMELGALLDRVSASPQDAPG